MTQENLPPAELITRSLTRAEAQGFGLALTLMDGLVNPTSEAVMERLVEVARGETLVHNNVADDIASFERLSGNEFEPEKKVKMIDYGTLFGRRLNAEAQETARRLIDFMASDLFLSRRIPPETQESPGE